MREWRSHTRFPRCRSFTKRPLLSDMLLYRYSPLLFESLLSIKLALSSTYSRSRSRATMGPGLPLLSQTINTFQRCPQGPKPLPWHFRSSSHLPFMILLLLSWYWICCAMLPSLFNPQLSRSSLAYQAISTSKMQPYDLVCATSVLGWLVGPVTPSISPHPKIFLQKSCKSLHERRFGTGNFGLIFAFRKSPSILRSHLIRAQIRNATLCQIHQIKTSDPVSKLPTIVFGNNPKSVEPLSGTP